MKRKRLRERRFGPVVMLVGTLCALGAAQEPPADARLEFFESRIRPRLVEHCLACHAADTEQSGGLSLDSVEGWQRGGDLGPAIVAGDPQASRLMTAIRYQDPNLQMPPDGQLPEHVIADFQQWIQEGAVDPRRAGRPPEASRALPLEDAAQHWAYRAPDERAIQRRWSELVQARTGRLPTSPLDVWLDQPLEEADLTANPPASPAVIVRRLCYDLHGLPPTVGLVERYCSDTRPDAYERLVDELLASPRFAEHWARHWLDVARYAESLTLRGFILPNAWRYRDYCIQAFAEDRPYDQQVREQVAGDLISNSNAATVGVDDRALLLVAPTFLLLGNTNLEEQDKQQLEMDVIDEQLETLGRAFLAQTLGCARCHDHKFDPIPTADYYALAGILKMSRVLDHENVSKWLERPLPVSAERAAEYERLESRLAALDQEMATLRTALDGAAEDGNKRPVAPATLPGTVVDDAQARIVGNWQRSRAVSPFVGEGYLHDGAAGQGQKTVTFEPAELPPGEYEVRLAYTAGDNRASNALVRVFSADGEKELRLDQRRAGEIQGLWQLLGRFRFEPNGQAFVVLANDDADGHVIADAVHFLPLEQVPAVNASLANAEPTAREGAKARLESLVEQRRLLAEQLALRPMAMSLVPVEQPADLPIHIRGSVHQLGEVVPRGVLRCAATSGSPQSSRSDVTDAPSGNDRRMLAEWLADSANPLTARVMVNRVWLWSYGEGLVRTPDNFGTTGEPPTHPELLDWLAAEFVEHGWSVKHLVRTLVCSDAYRRSSLNADPMRARDPENRFWWRAERRWATGEMLRDAMLQASGELLLTGGGPKLPRSLQADYEYQHDEPCRSIYVPWLRNGLPRIVEIFDGADPSISMGRRNHGITAQQSLLLLNDPWVVARADDMAARLLADFPTDGQVARLPRDRADWEELVVRVGWDVLGRSWSPSEHQTLVDYLQGHSQNAESSRKALAQVIHAAFASVDFRFIE